ncbi:MAG: sigma-70 family RNA polymerase sigma factor [Chloroflexi bacterium]|nr:sigma-70 family RNA polymerase sigma factor [Chloroflexota bacterium]
MTEEDFAEVVENYTSFVYNVAYRMMNSPDDADDVVQDAFISAYRAKDRFRGDAQVTTWLYRITVNAALMRIRKDKRRIQMTAPEDSYLERNVANWEDTPDKAALNSELSREIKSKIALLPEDLRTAVVLRDVQGLSNTEASEILDISISALKARLHRGRVSLRDMLNDYVKQRTD